MYHTNTAMASPATMINPVNTPSLLMIDSHYYPSSTVPTPPSSASSIDLPPIPALSSYGRHLPLDDGPPSPASPQKSVLPAYLEPQPQVNEMMNSTFKIRPQLFHQLAPPLVSFTTRRATAPTLTHQLSTIYSPLPPRRSHSQSMDRSSSSYLSTPNSSPTHQSNKKRKSCHSTTTTTTTTTPFQGQETCTSPTLTAACASAANLHTSSSLGSVSTSASPSSSPSSTPLDTTWHRIKSDEDKKQLDQSMFLTKNAHIKRPRNAWIHFRCHYGQALKTQDPTLRAEEISKRASRRWSSLSENEKRPWHQMAEQEKQAHKEAFPEYRYCPKRATTVNITTSAAPPLSIASPSFSQHGLFRLPNGLDSTTMVKKSK
ncbi:hypothetical protein BC941DRAFT_429046 [Chlamydoabsidia padenii]|nr:hypothetical protein BC941DRAFT_429046 [Chlamydoabsidia padenii]